MHLLLHILLLASITTTINSLRFVHFSNGNLPKPQLAPKPNRSVFDYGYRLPKTFLPSHYKLKLTFDAQKDQIKGRVMIDLKVREPTNYLVMHAHPDYISNISGQVQMGNLTINLSPLEWNRTRQTIALRWPQTSQNTTWRVDATFTTRPRLPYDRALDGIRKLDGRLATMLESLGARKIMPCFDEPQLKAKFELTIKLQNFSPNYIVLSNSKGNKSGNVWSFAETPRMSTYLLAFAVGDYTPVCLDAGPTQQCNTKMLPGQSGKVCHWLAPRYKYSEKRNAMLMNKFGLTSYCSLQKYLNVQNGVELHFLVDDFLQAGLEDWGLIYLGGSILVYGSKSTYAHEITHYWFGDTVSPSSWPHLWLNEGFASFVPSLSTIIIFQDNATIISEAKYMQEQVEYFEQVTHSTYTVVDAVWANDFGKTQGIDTLPYTKGALILKMLHDVVGEKCFQTALVNYMKMHMFGNADTDLLLASFQESVNLYKVKGWEEGKLLDVKTFTTPFLYKTGIPKLKISKSGDLKVSVEKSVPKGQKAQDWPLPLWASDTETKEYKIYWIVEEKTILDVSGNNVEWNKDHYTFASISGR